MTPEEADQRIILSRHTLAKYAQMAGGMPGPENLPLIDEEITILLGIAEDHPAKARKIDPLVAGWMGMQVTVRARLN